MNVKMIKKTAIAIFAVSVILCAAALNVSAQSADVTTAASELSQLDPAILLNLVIVEAVVILAVALALTVAVFKIIRAKKEENENSDQ